MEYEIEKLKEKQLELSSNIIITGGADEGIEDNEVIQQKTSKLFHKSMPDPEMEEVF